MNMTGTTVVHRQRPRCGGTVEQDSRRARARERADAVRPALVWYRDALSSPARTKAMLEDLGVLPVLDRE